MLQPILQYDDVINTDPATCDVVTVTGQVIGPTNVCEAPNTEVKGC